MINKKLLQSCDILLFKETHKSTIFQRLIVWGQKIFYHVPKAARYSHVAIVAGDTNLLIEAVWPKIRIVPISYSNYKNRECIEVYRIKNLTDAQREKILTYAYGNVGEWYSTSLLLLGWTRSKHSNICSTFVSKACHDADLDIPFKQENSKLVIPDNYYNDPSLEFIC